MHQSPSEQDRHHLKSKREKNTSNTHPQPLPSLIFFFGARRKRSGSRGLLIPANRTPYKAPEWELLPPDSYGFRGSRYSFSEGFFLSLPFCALPFAQTGWEARRIDLNFCFSRFKAEWPITSRVQVPISLPLHHR